LWGEEGLRRTVEEVCQRVWSGEGFTDSWRKRIIVPIAKKWGTKRIEVYRGG